MKDEKQQPTAEQIAQWRVECIEYVDVHRDTGVIAAYLAGRQAAFDEYRKRTSVLEGLLREVAGRLSENEGHQLLARITSALSGTEEKQTES